MSGGSSDASPRVRLAHVLAQLPLQHRDDRRIAIELFIDPSAEVNPSMCRELERHLLALQDEQKEQLNTTTRALMLLRELGE